MERRPLGTKDKLACAMLHLNDHYYDIGDVNEGELRHIIDVNHRVLEEKSWVITSIYPAKLGPTFGEFIKTILPTWKMMMSRVVKSNDK